MKLVALSVLSVLLTGCLTAQSRDASVPSELAGKWYTGSSSSLAFLDRSTGISDAAGGNGASLEIKADGNFVKATVLKTGLYGCSVIAFGYQTGELKTSGHTLVFDGTENFISYKDSCNPQTNSEKNKPPLHYEYQYEQRTDDDGRTLLCLSNSKQEECFKREDPE
jgi:hypothetical protein